MIWDPSTLATLSAPGFNRAIGAGDVVPYWGPQPGQNVGGAGAAAPGVSYDPNLAGGATSPAGGGDSALNNLSALTPILNQIVAQQQQDAIVSGQGNAQANPLQGATPGVSSGDIAQQIQQQAGGVPIAGSGGVPGIAPSGGASTPSGGAPGADAGSGVGAPGAPGAPGDGSGDAGGPGAPGGGDSGNGAGTGNGSGDAGVAGPGDAGVSGGPAAGTPGGPGDSGDGGGGAGGGAGATVICTELRRQGYLDAAVWQADAAFGRAQSQATRDGYRLWAAPIARGMARSRVLTAVVAAFAIPWALEMAHQMGVREHGSLFGRLIMAIGLPLCTFLGEKHHIKGVRA